MAKNKQGKHKPVDESKLRFVNRRARHDYHILEELECGIVLEGSEVKSIRNGQVTLVEGFAQVDPKRHELFLHNVEVARYANAGAYGHALTRQSRKLLAHRREITKLLNLTSERGVTLIPLEMYFVEGRVKVRIGVAKGKREFDKREDLKKRDDERAMARAMTRRVI